MSATPSKRSRQVIEPDEEMLPAAVQAARRSKRPAVGTDVPVPAAEAPAKDTDEQGTAAQELVQSAPTVEAEVPVPAAAAPTTDAEAAAADVRAAAQQELEACKAALLAEPAAQMPPAPPPPPKKKMTSLKDVILEGTEQQVLAAMRVAAGRHKGLRVDGVVPKDAYTLPAVGEGDAAMKLGPNGMLKVGPLFMVRGLLRVLKRTHKDDNNHEVPWCVEGPAIPDGYIVVTNEEDKQLIVAIGQLRQDWKWNNRFSLFKGHEAFAKKIATNRAVFDAISVLNYMVGDKGEIVVPFKAMHHVITNKDKPVEEQGDWTTPLTLYNQDGKMLENPVVWNLERKSAVAVMLQGRLTLRTGELRDHNIAHFILAQVEPPLVEEAPEQVNDEMRALGIEVGGVAAAPAVIPTEPASASAPGFATAPASTLGQDM